FVPAARAHNHKSVRNRLARVADHIETKDLSSPHRMSRVGPGPMSVFIDGAYIRAVPGFQTRHFEIIIGRIETDGRVARHFASAPNISTSNVDTIRATLRAQGWIPGRNVMVFSDGDPALKGAVIRAARQQVTHVLDWFHISMRVRHIEQAFEGIRQFEPELKSCLLTSA
ncbi:ISKra4 family transposase, partial [Methylocystis sp. NLS-7]|nr:ISKra4 family transposase [Methylocystis suflitae]